MCLFRDDEYGDFNAGSGVMRVWIAPGKMLLPIQPHRVLPPYSWGSAVHAWIECGEHCNCRGHASLHRLLCGSTGQDKSQRR